MDRKEAIEVIKKNYPHVGISGSEFESALRELIQELKESEDEKIRKALIELVYSDANDLIGGVEKRLCVSYLEKQKEQNPEIKYVYPIFKVGDTIKPKAYNESHRINKIKDDNYVLDNGFTFPIVGQDVWEIVERKFAEWSEEDERKFLEIRCLIGNYRTGNDEYELYSWIDKIKDRVQPQPKQEWSEFEERIFKLLRQYKECDIPLTPENIKAEASMLWPDLEKYFFDLYGKEGEGDSALRSFYYRGLANGKAEALKDLPRWRKCGKETLRTYGDEHFEYRDGVAYVVTKKHEILLSDLEKLPGFNE